jgi:hypothetical protein
MVGMRISYCGRDKTIFIYPAMDILNLIYPTRKNEIYIRIKRL